MSEEMNLEFSPSIGALAKALAAAQKKITGASRDKRNPHTGSMYADLAGVWSACREPLTENGLAVVQTTEPHGLEGVCVVTMLLHESGEWIRGKLFLPCVGQRRKDGTIMPVDAQTFGSTLTYARRYSLAAIVGVAPEDDDGEAAVKNAREQAKPAAVTSPPAKSDVDVAALEKAIATAKDTTELAKAILAAGRAKDAGKLTPDVIAHLNAVRERRLGELEAPEAA